MGNGSSSSPRTPAERQKSYVASTIGSFRRRVMAFIQYYFDPSLDLAEQKRREAVLLTGKDKRAHHLFWLLFDALDYGKEPAEKKYPEPNPEPIQEEEVDDDGNLVDSAAAAAVHDGVDLIVTQGPVSLADGFVDVRHMRRCIKAFFDPTIDVDNEDADSDEDRKFRANVMRAVGFANRLADVRRIVEVFFDLGLDAQKRRRIVAKMRGKLEDTLDAREAAVSTGRFKLI